MAWRPRQLRSIPCQRPLPGPGTLEGCARGSWSCRARDRQRGWGCAPEPLPVPLPSWSARGPSADAQCSGLEAQVEAAPWATPGRSAASPAPAAAPGSRRAWRGPPYVAFRRNQHAKRSSQHGADERSTPAHHPRQDRHSLSLERAREAASYLLIPSHLHKKIGGKIEPAGIRTPHRGSSTRESNH